MKTNSITKRYTRTLLLFAFVAIGFNGIANSQEQMEIPQPPKEMEVFKAEVGEWECDIKAWEGPGSEPKITKGSESNRMLGGFWLISDFKGNMMGMDFQGHGTYSYDNEKKKYVGTWRDSLSPFLMHTEGSWDKEKKTLTMVGDAPGPDGKTWTHIMDTAFKKDGKKVMTMHLHPQGAPDQKMKLFEMSYSKKETKEKK